MYTTKAQLTLSLSICSLGLLFRSWKLWIEADLMLRILRMKFLIWPNHNYQWLLLCRIWLNVDREISLYQCLSMQKPSMTMTRDKMEQLLKYLINFDKASIFSKPLYRSLTKIYQVCLSRYPKSSWAFKKKINKQKSIKVKNKRFKE